MRRLFGLLSLSTALALGASCNGTTGGALVTFNAYASGAPHAGDPFPAGRFTIQLTAATMHIGAVYFNQATPSATGFGVGTQCIASTLFAAQVPGPVDVDLLSTTPQEFSVTGSGTSDTALSWQLWLTDGDVNAANASPIVDLEGIATDAQGNAVSFAAVVSINEGNRWKPSGDPAQPGLDPLCAKRIVQIPTDTRFFSGGTLYVTIDPRAWFTDIGQPIDFSPGQLPLVGDPNCNPDAYVSTNLGNFALSPETTPPQCGASGQPCCTSDAGAATPCLGALTCTQGFCAATYCIPNSSFLSGSDPGMNAGINLFSSVATGAAYSARYVESDGE
jgi:hypothetical protein